MALWNFSGTTWVSRYQKKHSPTDWQNFSGDWSPSETLAPSVKNIVKSTEYSSWQTCLTATGTHVPHGIIVLPATQQKWHSCLYPQPIKAGTRFSNPRGMQGWVGLSGGARLSQSLLVLARRSCCLAMVRRCTSSGPSAMRRARDHMNICDSGVSWHRPSPPCAYNQH